MIVFSSLYYYLNNYKYNIDKKIVKTNKTHKQVNELSKTSDCQAPQWAIDKGHEEMWKNHNCK